MDLLSHVRIIRKSRANTFQVEESRTTWKNLASGISPDNLKSGICIRKIEDLRRYGRGFCRLIVYATMLLDHGCQHEDSFSELDKPRMCYVALATLKTDLYDRASPSESQKSSSSNLRATPMRKALHHISLEICSTGR